MSGCMELITGQIFLQRDDRKDDEYINVDDDQVEPLCLSMKKGVPPNPYVVQPSIFEAAFDAISPPFLSALVLLRSKQCFGFA